jgi:hypothetical protein
MHMLFISDIIKAADTKKKVILVTCVVFSKLIRKNRDENSNKDDLRKTDKYDPRYKFSYVERDPYIKVGPKTPNLCIESNPI